MPIKFLMILGLLTSLIAEKYEYSNIHIWNQTEKPSIENNFQQNKRIYQTDNIIEATSVTLFESLFHIDTIIEKKKLETDFKYLEEFDNSIKSKGEIECVQ